jgi:diguanylate cyclase
MCFRGLKASTCSIDATLCPTECTFPMREPTASDAQNPAAPTPAGSEERVRADSLALLFGQSFPVMYMSFVMACVLCWTLWGRVDAFTLLSWLAVLGASTVVRWVMFRKYFRAKPQGLAILAWERPYAMSLMLSSSVWGLGALWLMPPTESVEQLVVLFFVVGLAGGSMITYSAHRGMTICAALSVLLPSTIWLYTQPTRMGLGLAVASTTYLLGAMFATRVLYSAMRRRLLLSYALEQANEVADRLARTDDLTGMSNRRAFMEMGEQTIRLCQRQGKPLSALLMDVDHFKYINDTYGHGAGDRVLRHVGALLAQQFRAADVCGRIGGEEFAVLLADTDADTAAALAEKLCQAVASASTVWQEHTLQVTMSIGVATRSDNLSTLLQNADAAMYQAKNSGRNRVVRHPGPGNSVY